MGRHTEAMERVAEAILETPGDGDGRAACRAVAAYAGGGESEDLDELRPYVDKVAQSAYKVTDEDVDRLRQRVTRGRDLRAATGRSARRGAARLDAGLQALGQDGALMRLSAFRPPGKRRGFVSDVRRMLATGRSCSAGRSPRPSRT